MKQENKAYSGTFVPTHQEEEQHALIDALPQLVWIIRPDGSVAYTNQRWRDYSNLLRQYSREQEGFQAQHLDDSSHVQDRLHTLPPIDSLSEKEIWLQSVHPEIKKVSWTCGGRHLPQVNPRSMSIASGKVFYFAPDTLKWEPTDKSHSDLLLWALSGDVDMFYKNMRWPGWEDELSSLTGDQGLSIYPFPFARNGLSVAECSRRPVPMHELWGLYVDDIHEDDN